MEGIIATAVLVALLAAGVFFAARKLYRDKKAGRTCCGGSDCSCCSGCGKKRKGTAKKGQGSPLPCPFYP